MSTINDSFKLYPASRSAQDPVVPGVGDALAGALWSIDATLRDLLHTMNPPAMPHDDSVANAVVDPQKQAALEALLASSPIRTLLADQTVNDIMINGPYEVYVDADGMLQRTELQFESHQQLREFVKAMLDFCGRRLNPKHPFADARLPDGSRVHVIAPPIAVQGMMVSIRKFPQEQIDMDRLLEMGTLSNTMATFFRAVAQSGITVVVSGGTSTGKTTLMNAISAFIPENQRIVTIEDIAELHLQQPHVVKLETTQMYTGVSGTDEVTMRDLLRNALRMRPDRIIVGEVRGPEAYDMIQAMNTGHEGSMTTVHSNNPRDALMRLENMVTSEMASTPSLNVRKQIANAVTLVVQLARLANGKRIVSQITEVLAVEGDTTTMQDLFVFEHCPAAMEDPAAYMKWTGIIPRNHKLRSLVISDGPPRPKTVRPKSKIQA